MPLQVIPSPPTLVQLITAAANTVQTAAGSQITLQGHVPADTSGHVAVIVNSTDTLSTAKLFQVQYHSFPVFSIDGSGGQMQSYASLTLGGLSGSLTESTFLYSGGHYSTVGAAATTTSTLNLVGVLVDSSTAIGVRMGSYNNLVTGGSKLVSIQNNILGGGTEVASIAFDGTISGLGLTLTLGGGGVITFADGSTQSTAGGGGVSNPLLATGGLPWTISGDGPNTSGHVGGVILDTQVNINTPGNKVHSIRNNGSEIAYWEADGTLQPGSPAAYGFGHSSNPFGSAWIDSIGTFALTQRFDATHNYVQLPVGPGATKIQGWATTSGSTVATILNSGPILSTNGDKLVSIQNSGTEAAYFGLLGMVIGGPSAFSYTDAKTPMLLKLRGSQTANFICEGTGGVSIPSVFFKHDADTLGVVMSAQGNSGPGGSFFSFATEGTGSNFTILPSYPDAYVRPHQSSANIHLQSWNGSAWEDNVLWGDSITLHLAGSAPDGASAVGTIIDTNAAYGTLGAELLSIRNGGVEKAYFDKDGNLVLLTVPGTIKMASPNGTVWTLSVTNAGTLSIV
jgi:hypothetical protein